VWLDLTAHTHTRCSGIVEAHLPNAGREGRRRELDTAVGGTRASAARSHGDDPQRCTGITLHRRVTHSMRRPLLVHKAAEEQEAALRAGVLCVRAAGPRERVSSAALCSIAARQHAVAQGRLTRRLVQVQRLSSPRSARFEAAVSEVLLRHLSAHT
jgi:hypothetical protein